MHRPRRKPRIARIAFFSSLLQQRYALAVLGDQTVAIAAAVAMTLLLALRQPMAQDLRLIFAGRRQPSSSRGGAGGIS